MSAIDTVRQLFVDKRPFLGLRLALFGLVLSFLYLNFVIGWERAQRARPDVARLFESIGPYPGSTRLSESELVDSFKIIEGARFLTRAPWSSVVAYYESQATALHLMQCRRMSELITYCRDGIQIDIELEGSREDGSREYIISAGWGVSAYLCGGEQSILGSKLPWFAIIVAVFFAILLYDLR
jgi:hypothetical protein